MKSRRTYEKEVEEKLRILKGQINALQIFEENAHRKPFNGI
jgi:hypothetical protein